MKTNKKDRAAPSKIVVTHQIFPETRVMLEPLGEIISPAPGKGALAPGDLRKNIKNAEAMMAFMPDRVDASFLSRAPHLRIVAGALKGYDNFDAVACMRRGIWLTVVPDLLTVPTAELTIGLMIGLARHLCAGDAHVRSGAFRGWRPRFYGRGLQGETAGLIGMGAIGRAIAQRLRGFGMNLLYTDPYRLEPMEERSLGVARVSLSTLLRRSDYMIVAAPLTARTKHLIDDHRLARIKPGSLLINPSRGSVVDESAVLRALADGRLGGYAADVFEMEDWLRRDRPRTVARALRNHPNTLFTPHLGSAVIEARQGIERQAAQNIIDYFSGKRPRDAVAGPGHRA